MQFLRMGNSLMRKPNKSISFKENAKVRMSIPIWGIKEAERKVMKRKQDKYC